ncbi:3'-5' exonuclease [Brevibacillus massiliensis]|jgi:inhibitor of KinA sporulation pathway (predicted exonuclease)|uniref:3'-5' exonuclease n=1 Tax=Brevibacillus massiliensis TaxID=1118054 RepID=UPI00037F95F5|nr:3'-5' exonuclease [Brevibacillus massiliensis]
MRNYILFDLEATCWEKPDQKQSEIIEIGAVKLDASLQQTGTFSRFVRPTVHPALSEFCTALTSITQKEVDAADPFAQAMEAFEQWIVSSSRDVLLISWGFYDKRQIQRECAAKQYSGTILQLLAGHVSLKHQFAEVRQIAPCPMTKALELLQLPLIGVHHRALDDAQNIARIFRSIFPELTLLT